VTLLPISSVASNIGGVRERLVVTRRDRGKTVCARGAYQALLNGPSNFTIRPQRWPRFILCNASGFHWTH
jgi:hypothetical protein